MDWPGNTSLANPDLMCEVAARLIFFNVRWIKMIPAFASLDRHDQALLIGHSWCELFLLGLAQFQIPFETRAILEAQGKIDVRDQSQY